MTGNRLSREKGALIVDFPPRATYKAIHAKISRVVADVRKDDRRHEPVFNRFSLQALEKSDPKKVVTQFKQPVRVVVKYDLRTMPIRNERDLTLVYWDTSKKRWFPLKSFVDTNLKTVTALTNHFTDFGLLEAPNVASYLPSLEGFQTDLFTTGAASASYGLEVPPGRGGLVPKLELEYSSSGVDTREKGFDTLFVPTSHAPEAAN